MIAIWDNGRAYSDHGIVFYDVTAYTRGETEAIFAFLKRWGWDSEGFVMGYAEEILWLDGIGTAELETVIYWAQFEDPAPDDLRALPPAFLETALGRIEASGCHPNDRAEFEKALAHVRAIVKERA